MRLRAASSTSGAPTSATSIRHGLSTSRRTTMQSACRKTASRASSRARTTPAVDMSSPSGASAMVSRAIPHPLPCSARVPLRAAAPVADASPVPGAAYGTTQTWCEAHPKTAGCVDKGSTLFGGAKAPNRSWRLRLSLSFLLCVLHLVARLLLALSPSSCGWRQVATGCVSHSTLTQVLGPSSGPPQQPEPQSVPHTRALTRFRAPSSDGQHTRTSRSTRAASPTARPTTVRCGFESQRVQRVSHSCPNGQAP